MRKRKSAAADRGLRIRGGVYYARKKVDGVDHEISLETTSKAVARQRRGAWLTQRIEQKWGETKAPTFAEAAEMFRLGHFPDLKPKSVERYQDSLKALTPHFSKMRVDAIRFNELQDFERARRKVVTGSSILRDLACLSAIYTYLEDSELGPSMINPVKGYKRKRKKTLRENEARTRYFDQPEEMLVLGSTTDKWQDMIVFAIDTGLRRAEQFQLRWSDVDLDRQILIVRRELAKSGRTRPVPLLPRTSAILARMKRQADPRPSDFVFRNRDGKPYSLNSRTVNAALKRAIRYAKIPDASWHDLRRTCGCRLLQVYGFSMEQVKEWLGHSSVAVTEKHYAFLGIKELQMALSSSLASLADRIQADFRAKAGTERGSDFEDQA